MTGLFKITYQVDFSEENKERFTTQHPSRIFIIAQVNWIMQILSAVQQEEQEKFKDKVISAELLGGAGSIVDVWIEDEKKMKKLDSLMNDFLELTAKSGLNDRAVKSIMTRKIKKN